MKKTATLFIGLLLGLASFGQQVDSTKNWSYKGEAGLNFSQLSLTNWNAGGLSSIALNGLVRFGVNYDTKKAHWENLLESGYGFIRRDGENTIKSDDRLLISSQYSRKWKNNAFSYSALLNFNTQFTDGFNYPNDSVAISSFMAPAYLSYSAGLSYKPSENFSILVAPIGGKMTFVLHDSLSAAGAFGLDPGKQFRNEIGALVKSKLKITVMKNVEFESKLVLFSNYINNPQNIDVNWQTVLSMKVNTLISVSVNTELIYDDDVNIAVDSNDDGITDASGPRVQFKELLGIGITYKFKR